MKKETKFTVADKEYTLCYSNRDLANVERSIGRSLLSVIMVPTAETIRSMSIDVIVAGVLYGVKELNGEDPYDFIDRFCEAGGTLDALGGLILNAWIETGLFTSGKTVMPEEEKTPSKK